MRYDYKYRINNKDKGDLAMELKELQVQNVVRNVSGIMERICHYSS